MNTEQVELVMNSWTKVMPIADEAAGMFYGKLFELDPSLKDLFKGDMKSQGQKLMVMINTAVNSLDRLDDVVPAVEALGERHVGYGVKDEDYDTVGEALIWTLATGLGDAFTDEVKSAWVDVYTLLADTMKGAAARVAA